MRVKVVFVSPLKEEEKKKLLVPSIAASEDAGGKDLCGKRGSWWSGTAR